MENGSWIYKGYRRLGSEIILRALVDPFANGLSYRDSNRFPKVENCPSIFVKFSS